MSDDDSAISKDNLNYKSISCENIPELFLDKLVAKEHFSQFGKIKRFILRPKRLSCTVEYQTEEDAEKAFVGAGTYKGIPFHIKYSPNEVAHTRNTEEWVNLDPEVQAELDAMGYTLRKTNRISSTKTYQQKVSKPIKTKSVFEVIQHPYGNTRSELEAILKKQANSVEDKYRILDARDKLIRLMSQRTNDIKQVVSIKGICYDMCPEKERLMRDAKHQVSLFELDGTNRSTIDHSKAVKEYSRSSADQETPLAHELRPEPVLKMTMNYLLRNIIDTIEPSGTNLGEWFHFLWDRTRSIRKDITQQELCSPEAVELVEQCARFHIHCSARLVAEEPSIFDQKINTENLTKCLQTLKYMYHDLRLKNVKCKNESEFRCYIILLNLNDSNFLWEIKQLPNEIQNSSEVRLALEIYLAMANNNYIKFFRFVRKTTYMNACILLRYFTQVRIQAIKTIIKAYNWPRHSVGIPISYLTYILAFESEDATAQFFQYYGLSINTGKVMLDRVSFNIPDVPFFMDRAFLIVEAKRKICVGEAICGRPLDSNDYLKQHVVQDSFDENGFLKPEAFDTDNSLKNLKVKQKAQKDDDGNLFKIPLPSPPISPKYMKASNWIGKAGVPEKKQEILDEGTKPTFTLSFGTPQFPIVSKTDLSNANLFQTTFTEPASVDTGDKVDAILVDPKPGIPEYSKPSFTFTPSATITKVNVPQVISIFGQAPTNLESDQGNDVFLANINESALKTHNFSPTNSNTNTSKYDSISRSTDERDLNESSQFSGMSFLSTLKTKSIPPKKRTEFLINAEEEKRRQEEEIEKRDKELEKEKRKLQLEREQEKQRLVKIREEKRAQSIGEINRQSTSILEEILDSYICSESEIIAKIELERFNKILTLSMNEMESLLYEVIANELTEIVNDNVQEYEKLKHQKLIEIPSAWVVNSKAKASMEIFHPMQNETLELMRRYKLGKPENLKWESHGEKYIDLFDIFSKIFDTKISENNHGIVKSRNYVKFLISLPSDAEEVKGFSSYITKWLHKTIKRRQPIEEDKEFFCESRDSTSVCIRKIEGTSLLNEAKKRTTTECNHAHAVLFVMTCSNLSQSRKRLHHLIKLSNIIDKIPVAIIVYNSKMNTDVIRSDLELENLVKNDKISHYTIYNHHGFMHNNLREMFKRSFQFLARTMNQNSELEMRKLTSFICTALGKELWKRFTDTWLVKPSFRKFCNNPKLIIALYNDAVDRIIRLVSESLDNYPEFPDELRPFVPPIRYDIPMQLEHFPNDWKNDDRNASLKTFFEQIKLKQWECNITNFENLEISIQNYTKLCITNDDFATRSAYNAIKCLPEELTETQSISYDQVFWIDVVKSIALDILTYYFEIHCNNLPCEIIYKKTLFDEYTSNPWWVEDNYLKTIGKIRITDSDTLFSEDESRIKNDRINVEQIIKKGIDALEKADRAIENKKRPSQIDPVLSKELDETLDTQAVFAKAMQRNIEYDFRMEERELREIDYGSMEPPESKKIKIMEDDDLNIVMAKGFALVEKAERIIKNLKNQKKQDLS